MATNVISSTESRYILISNGIGPKGERGPAGETGVASVIAGENIGGHAVINLREDGLAYLASCDVLQDAYCSAITQNAAVISGTLDIKSFGILEHSGWSFTPNTPVFLGLNGTITQSIPISALFIKTIGVALTATKININFQTAIFL